MNRIVIIALAVLSCLSILPAQAGDLSLAVYNDGRLLVREVRSMAVPASGEMVYSGVPETIRPDTLSVRSLTAPKQFHLLETGYRYQRISADSLLDQYVGERLTVILPDPADANARVSREATLLSAGSPPVFEIDDKIYVGSYDAVVLPSVPDGLDREPLLRWLVRNQGTKQHDLEVSYLASGMSWQADYAMVLDADERSASLSAWATIANGSGTDFDNAEVKLVAGDVGRAPGSGRMLMAKTEAAPMMAMDSAGMDEPQVRDVGEYHVYPLPRTVSLGNGASRQVRLFAASKVPVTTELISRFSVGNHRYGNHKTTQPVNAMLKLENGKKQGLGLPMPSGTARIYKSDADGAALLMGEDMVRHTAAGSELRLRLGSPFDINVERVQTEHRQTGKRSCAMTWEITVRNGSSRERSIKLREQFHGQWKIGKANMKYRKLSAGVAEFELLLPAGTGATTLRYSVDLSW